MSIVLALVVLLLVSGCAVPVNEAASGPGIHHAGASGPPTVAAADESATSPDDGLATTTPSDGLATAAPSTEEASPHTASSTDSGATDSAATAQEPPAASSTEEPTSVPVSATVSPTCVARGGEITLTVSTSPDIATSYQAIYNDGSGGGPPPYGAGHGGNDAGMTDAEGRYVSTWRVANTAPLGAAQVEVVVAFGGDFGRAWPSFEVVESLSGGCS